MKTYRAVKLGILASADYVHLNTGTNTMQKNKTDATFSRGVSFVFVYCFLGSGQIESIGIHHLVPGRHEILKELLLRICARVNFSDRPQLGIGPEDQVNA